MAFGKKQLSEKESLDTSERRKIFLRPGISIDEDPDSLDSVISNPSCLPLTIVPSLVRSSTCGSGISRQFSRQGSQR